MNTETAKKNFPKLRDRTLCFLLKDGKVLLWHKKYGFWAGKLVGIWGKTDPGETVEQAMMRETQEEIWVIPTITQKVWELSFYFPDVETPDKRNQKVHVYIAEERELDPIETEEIRPERFELSAIPLDNMRDDAQYRLQDALNWKTFNGHFIFNNDMKVVEKEITIY